MDKTADKTTDKATDKTIDTPAKKMAPKLISANIKAVGKRLKPAGKHTCDKVHRKIGAQEGSGMYKGGVGERAWVVERLRMHMHMRQAR